MMMRTLLQLALQFLSRLSPVQSIIHLHNLLFCMNNPAEEKPKELGFLSPSHLSQEESTGREGLRHTTQNPTDHHKLIITKGWFPKYLLTLLLDPKMDEIRTSSWNVQCNKISTDEPLCPTWARQGFYDATILCYGDDIYMYGKARKSYIFCSLLCQGEAYQRFVPLELWTCMGIVRLDIG